MKVSSTQALFTSVAACMLASSDAFAPTSQRIQRPVDFRLSPRTAAMALETSDFGSAMPEAATPLEMLGIEDGKLAIGADPIEVLTYIGTREDLIAKTLEDIPSFDRPKAVAEVDKFLMDYEMIGMYIQYQKVLEEDPDFVVPEKKEDLFSFRNIVIVYLGYIAVTTGPTVLQKYVAAEQAAGSWQGTNIPFIDEWLERSMAVGGDGAVQAVSDAVQSSGLGQ